MHQYSGSNVFTLEAASQLTPGYVAEINTTTAAAEHASADDVAQIGVILESLDEAPYETTILGFGPVVDLVSDGSGAIAPGDKLTAGGTAGQVKARAIADGTSARATVAIALANVAATQGLPVKAMLCHDHWVGA